MRNRIRKKYFLDRERRRLHRKRLQKERLQRAKKFNRLNRQKEIEKWIVDEDLSEYKSRSKRSVSSPRHVEGKFEVVFLFRSLFLIIK